MLTVDVLTLTEALSRAANDAQRESLVFVSHRFRAEEFIRRADGAFEFGRANAGTIIGIVTRDGKVTSNREQS